MTMANQFLAGHGDEDAVAYSILSTVRSLLVGDVILLTTLGVVCDDTGRH